MGGMTIYPAVAPYFDGSLSTQQTITSGVWSKANLDTIIDSNGWWDATNHWYLPLLAGKYWVEGGCNISGSTVSSIELAISKNGLAGSGGTIIRYAISTGLATAANNSVDTPAVIITMNGTTDKLELDCNPTATGTVQFNGPVLTSLTIRYIGP